MGAFASRCASKELPQLDEGWLAIQCLIGSFFFSTSMVDLSVASAAIAQDSAPMLAYHAAWKGNAPYFRVLLGAILLTLPFALYQMVTEDVIGMLYRGRATRRRHLIGTLTLMFLVCVISIAVGKAGPREAAMAGLVDTGNVDAAAVTSDAARVLAGELWRWYLCAVLLNFILLVMPFLKYGAAKSGSPAPAASATDTKPQPSKKTQ